MARPPVLLLGLTAAFAASVVLAQTKPAARATPDSRIAAQKRATAVAGKTVTPDPDLLDGSAFEAEKKPMFGMISEIELAGSEKKSERVGGSSQPPPPGGSSAMPAAGPSGPPGEPGGEENRAAKIDEQKDDRATNGPEAKPEGIAVKNLEVPEGAAAQAGGPSSAPREMQIGDATLQIQTVKQQPQVVGTESTSTQQYDKKMPQGKQTDNRNRGAEKGRVMPKGL